MWVRQHVGMCMCIRAYSLANPARNAYAPYCDVICGPSVSTIFFDIISQTVRFSEKVTERKMFILLFSTTFVQSISYSKKNLARYSQKCRNVFMQSTRYFCRVLIKSEFSRHIFEKKPLKYQVLSKSVQWEPNCFVGSDGQKDMTKPLVAFSNFANAPKNHPLGMFCRNNSLLPVT
jgi:hypothetical protein